MNISIGITERGDAGLDLSWYEKLSNPKSKLSGAILITKNLNDNFIAHVLQLHKSGIKLIVHATCTGYGGTQIEPNVPEPYWQLSQLRKLIHCGFPKEQCVLRLDPIIPTKNGIMVAKTILDTAASLNLLPDMRIRISILDEYKHVKERFKEHGILCNYTFFQPSSYMIYQLMDALSEYPYTFECCAEPKLTGTQYKHIGCISKNDLDILHIAYEEDMDINPQNRRGCLCLSCKRELLSSKTQCPHKCLYCYWKN